MRRRRRNNRGKQKNPVSLSIKEGIALVGISSTLIGAVYFTFTYGRHVEAAFRPAQVLTGQADINETDVNELKKPQPGQRPGGFSCPFVEVTDGDTFRCGTIRVRLAGIDAPEMPGHCRRGRDCTPGDPLASRNSLASMLQQTPVNCLKTDTDRYGRTIASCTAGGVNLSCELVRSGFAVKRYGGYPC